MNNATPQVLSIMDVINQVAAIRESRERIALTKRQVSLQEKQFDSNEKYKEKINRFSNYASIEAINEGIRKTTEGYIKDIAEEWQNETDENKKAHLLNIVKSLSAGDYDTANKLGASIGRSFSLPDNSYLRDEIGADLYDKYRDTVYHDGYLNYFSKRKNDIADQPSVATPTISNVPVSPVTATQPTAQPATFNMGLYALENAKRKQRSNTPVTSYINNNTQTTKQSWLDEPVVPVIISAAKSFWSWFTTPVDSSDTEAYK